jgi:nitrate/TMAO reductase-like tetraheme cytochrome c subunit
LGTLVRLALVTARENPARSTVVVIAFVLGIFLWQGFKAFLSLAIP